MGQRSAGIVFVSVCVIIFHAWLGCSYMQVLLSLMWRDNGFQRYSPAGSYLSVGIALGILLFSIAGIVSGIGFYRLKEWARLFVVGYAVIWVAVIFSSLWYWYGARVNMIWCILLFPISGICYSLRPSVKAQFGASETRA